MREPCLPENLVKYLTRPIVLSLYLLIVLPFLGLSQSQASTDLYHCPDIYSIFGAGNGASPVVIGNGEAQPWPGILAGRPFYKVELDSHDPDALCNDGSTAVMFVRKADAYITGTDNLNPNQDRWHVHLKGGGNCRDHEACAKRWCSHGGGLDQPGLMSSVGTPDLMKGTGLLADKQQNRFASYNQAMVFYCSSDSWLGDAGPSEVVTVDAADQLWGNHLNTDIQFRGARIVEAAMTALESTGGLVVKDQNDNDVYTLPKMEDAQSVLISGDSAGGNGVRHHLDRLHERIENHTVTEDVPVIGFLDAGGAPYPSHPLLNYTNHPDFPVISSYTDLISISFVQQQSFHGVTTDALDETCVVNEPSLDTCSDHSYIQKNRVTTPIFHRFSFRDSTKRKSFVNTGMLASQLQLAEVTEDGAQDLIDVVVNPGIEPRDAPMQVMATQCTNHIVWKSGAYFKQRNGAPQRRVYQRLQDYVTSCETGTCVANNEIDNPLVGAFANGTVCSR